MSGFVYARAWLAGSSLRTEVQGLLQEHWREVAHDQHTRALDPDWEQFEAMERAGLLYIMTVRKVAPTLPTACGSLPPEGAVPCSGRPGAAAAGELVGYAAAIMRPHLHSRGTRSAYVDALFLTPYARQGLAGARFLRYIDTALAALGAQFIYWHVKPERDFAPILQRGMGYHFIETIWGRAIPQPQTGGR